MPLFSIDIEVAATVYIRANNIVEAKEQLDRLTEYPLELPADPDGDLPITSERFDSASLPAVSISPAVTVKGPYSGQSLERVEF